MPTIDPNTVVQCRETHSCGGNSVTSTIKDCCDHNTDPFGLAYTIPSVEGCQLCLFGKIMCSGWLII